MKQRLREFTYEASHKRGEKRQELDVSTCFAPLLGWVLSKFPNGQRQVVLAMDATYLSDRFIILAVSVVVAGCAIPVAWHIQRGDQKGEWNPIWKRLLTRLATAVPQDWTVYLLADSGLYSKKLFNLCDKTFKWPVLMRISGAQGMFKAKGARCWQRMSEMVTRGMGPMAWEGTCFKCKSLQCTLVAQWGADYDKPCLIVTNIKAAAIQHNVYAIRYWIECGFKDFKRGLFHWEQTKMSCPQRAERLWLVMSIALLWLTAVGEAALNLPQWAALSGHRKKDGQQTRMLSAPVLGWIELILHILKGEPLPYGEFNPYPWVPEPDT